ncbi:Uncharacterized protein dnm_047510 [Desulfonema magnum]|uniref:Uncharacterized protein n=1 Tax=Desulfonema magnum TaxID=45655 RepID=A0A975BPC4_9BACT|nr:Uncharacterized protein dnm_047510 [Desulfonema magnum]
MNCRAHSDLQQIEKFPGSVRDSRETRLFFPDRTPPRSEKAGFLQVRPVCPVTAQKLFDLLTLVYPTKDGIVFWVFCQNYTAFSQY